MGHLHSKKQRPESRTKMLASVEVPESLVCSLCWELFQDPVTTRCGHTYCRPCLHEWMQKQAECPFDRSPIHRRQLIQNKVLRKITTSLMEKAASYMEKSSGAQQRLSNPCLPSVTMDIGHEETTSNVLDVFADIPTAQLICPLHDGLMIDPILTRCGHSTCRVCMENHLRKTSNRCVCRKHIQISEILSNRPLHDFIQSSSLRCRFSLKRCPDSGKLEHDPLGCPELVSLESRQKHEAICDFAYAICPVDSRCISVRKKDLATHIESHEQKGRKSHRAQSHRNTTPPKSNTNERHSFWGKGLLQRFRRQEEVKPSQSAPNTSRHTISIVPSTLVITAIKTDSSSPEESNAFASGAGVSDPPRRATISHSANRSPPTQTAICSTSLTESPTESSHEDTPTRDDSPVVSAIAAPVVDVPEELSSSTSSSALYNSAGSDVEGEPALVQNVVLEIPNDDIVESSDESGSSASFAVPDSISLSNSAILAHTEEPYDEEVPSPVQSDVDLPDDT